MEKERAVGISISVRRSSGTMNCQDGPWLMMPS